MGGPVFGVHVPSIPSETDRDYTYDAFGRRVSTKLGSADTQFLYHGWHMIGAYDVDASDWLWQEIPMNHGEGMLEHIALDTNDLDSDINTTEYRQYAVHEDWQNTVWSLSDTAGDIVEEYRQGNPFGSSESFDASGASIGNFASEVHHHKRMHGGVVEPVSQLYDFRNRWYSPKAGAWLSRDPLGQVDSENLLQAMGGNPVSVTDKFGLCSGGGCWSGGGYEGAYGPGGGWYWESDGIPQSQECECPCDESDYQGVMDEFAKACNGFSEAVSPFGDEVTQALVDTCAAQSSWSYGGCESNGPGVRAQTSNDGVTKFACKDGAWPGVTCAEIVEHEIGQHAACFAMGGRIGVCDVELRNHRENEAYSIIYWGLTVDIGSVRVNEWVENHKQLKALVKRNKR